MVVLCPVPGLVRRRCPAAHGSPLSRWIHTVNPLTMGFVQQSLGAGPRPYVPVDPAETFAVGCSAPDQG